MECTLGEVPNEQHTACAKPSWTTATDCGNNQYLNDTSPDNMNWACVACPLGASCIGDITWSGVRSKFGHARCPNNRSRFETCSFPGACLGAKNPTLANLYYANQTDLALRNDDEKCNVGHVNPPENNSRCSTCSKGYAPVGNEVGRCQKCEGKETGIVELVLVVLLLVCTFVTLTALKMRSSGRKKAAHSILKRTILTRKWVAYTVVCESLCKNQQCHFRFAACFLTSIVFLLFFCVLKMYKWCP